MIFYKNSSGTIKLNSLTQDALNFNKVKTKNDDIKINNDSLTQDALNFNKVKTKLNDDIKINNVDSLTQDALNFNKVKTNKIINLREDIIINNGFILEHYLKLKDIEKEINEQLEYYKAKEEKEKDNNYIKLLEEIKININNNIEYYENIINKYNITSKRKHKHINKNKSYYKTVSEEERQRRNNKAKERYHNKKKQLLSQNDK